ncbi:hypothetical protein HRbin25_00611 [bacterium HR25]|jgi:acyl-coenzyme A thioesterase PaaI-like protein|nr:hypothetical protein HRbin25_00611 [bacterium HR25]
MREIRELTDSPRNLCFGCGRSNPEGLRIALRLEGEEVVGELAFRREHQGFPGRAHGGLAAAALDEAMGWAVYARDGWAVTLRMVVRFRRPMPVGETLTVRGRVVERRGRRRLARAWLTDAEGQVLAEAEGLFLLLSAEETERLREAFLAPPGA